LAWWTLGGLILMPVFLGMSAFAPLMMLMMPQMQMVAVGSLIGHLIYGVGRSTPPLVQWSAPILWVD